MIRDVSKFDFSNRKRVDRYFVLDNLSFGLKLRNFPSKFVELKHRISFKENGLEYWEKKIANYLNNDETIEELLSKYRNKIPLFDNFLTKFQSNAYLDVIKYRSKISVNHEGKYVYIEIVKLIVDELTYYSVSVENFGPDSVYDVVIKYDLEQKVNFIGSYPAFLCNYFSTN